MECHVCGDVKAQDHWIHHCSHPDIKAITMATLADMEALEMQYTDIEASQEHHELHARLVRAVSDMLGTDTEFEHIIGTVI